MKFLFFIFISALFIGLTSLKVQATPATGSSANLYSLATRQYLSGKNEESLALYQKAITKSESEFGKNSQIVGDLNFQLGVRAFWLSKFNLSEHCLKRAVEINPNSEAAQLMLINLLRFRNREVEAYMHTQQALKKHPDSMPLRKDMVICLQGNNPAGAAQQAFLVNCLQNDITDRIPTIQSQSAKKASEKTKDEKTKANIDKKNSAAEKTENKKADEKSGTKNETPANSKAVYEPVSKTPPVNKIAKVTRHRTTSSSGHKSNKMPTGLVPPPPPDIFGFLNPPKGGMKAKAGSIKTESAPPAKSEKAETTPTQTDEPKKHSVEHQSTESDPDFLIEWASVKKKRTPSK